MISVTDTESPGTKRFGQIAGNRSINAMIYRCFDHIDDSDTLAFVRLFRAQIADEQQVLHTFRELVLGGFLASRGMRLRHNLRIDNQTPDWSRLSGDGDPDAIIELLNLHPPRILERDISTVARSGMWVGIMPSHTRRLGSSLEGKSGAYRHLAERRRIPYVIGVFSEFTTGVEADELRDCLFHPEHGLFDAHPIVSGVTFFEERSGVYHFHYVVNPRALHPVDLPEGEF